MKNQQYLLQIQSPNNPQQILIEQSKHVDPWIVFWMITSSVGTYLALNIPKILNSPLFTKSMQQGINDHQANTNINVAKELTHNNLEMQQVEAKIDERRDLVALLENIFLKSQQGVSEQQTEVLKLFGQMMTLQATHAKAAEAQTAIATRMENIATSIYESITTLNLQSTKTQREVAEELKKVSHGQNTTHEYLATLAVELRSKLDLILEAQNDLKSGNRILEAKILEAIAALAR